MLWTSYFNLLLVWFLLFFPTLSELLSSNQKFSLIFKISGDLIGKILFKRQLVMHQKSVFIISFQLNDIYHKSKNAV